MVNTRQATQDVTLYAHRGSSLLAPENTAPAFELALSSGADVMEIDVRMSRDGQVIVIHDETIDRTCNGQGFVRELSLKDIKQYNAAHHFTDLQGIRWQDKEVRLMTLGEMFERFPNTPINIDIKDNLSEAACAVASVIEQHERMDTTNVGSFHSLALSEFRKRLPDVTTSAGQSEVAKLYFQRRLFRKPVFQYLQIPTRYKGLPLATRGFIKHAKQRDIKIVFWTINELKTMQQLIDSGATGFVTDRIDIAGKLLGRI